MRRQPATWASASKPFDKIKHRFAYDTRMTPAAPEMTSLQNEDYLFLRLYSIDFDTALGSLAALDRVTDGDVRVSMLRDIVVTYARPFSGNRGRSIRSHRLSDLLPAVVPQKHEALHAKLIRFRDQLFAHTDLEAYNPNPTKWVQQGRATFPMTFWALDYDTLNGYAAELADLVKSVDSAVHDEISRIESTL